MSKSEKTKVSRIKTKKKIWHKIIAPVVFGKKELGETYLASADQAVNRPLKINLKDLTGNVKDQNAYVSFKITKWHGTTLETVATGYELTSSFVKRAVRKNCNKSDDYFKLTTKDGKKVVIKTLMLTLNKVPRSTRSNLKKQLGKYLQEEVAKSTIDTLIGNLAAYKVQSPIKKRLSKIYPLREFAVRMMFIFSESKPETKEEVISEESRKIEAKKETEEPRTAQPSTKSVEKVEVASA